MLPDSKRQEEQCSRREVSSCLWYWLPKHKVCILPHINSCIVAASCSFNDIAFWTLQWPIPILWDAPAGNNGSCIHQSKYQVQNDEHNYHPYRRVSKRELAIMIRNMRPVNRRVNNLIAESDSQVDIVGFGLVCKLNQFRKKSWLVATASVSWCPSVEIE